MPRGSNLNFIDRVADAGTPYDLDPALWSLAMSEEYTKKIYVGSEAWSSPWGFSAQRTGQIEGMK